MNGQSADRSNLRVCVYATSSLRTCLFRHSWVTFVAAPKSAPDAGLRSSHSRISTHLRRGGTIVNDTYLALGNEYGDQNNRDCAILPEPGPDTSCRQMTYPSWYADTVTLKSTVCPARNGPWIVASVGPYLMYKYEYEYE